MRVILIAALAFGLAAAACATPSTLVWIPSTDIQAGEFTHFGVDVYAPSEGQSPVDYGLTFGGDRVEFGFDYLEPSSVKDQLRVNAKVLLADETPSAPRIVAGVYDLGGDAGSGTVYALASKTFPVGRLTIGCGVGRKSALGGDNKMLFAGFDKALSGKWWAAVDYQSGKSSLGATSVGVAYSLDPRTSVIVGYDWYNDSSLEDTATIQLDVNY
ncbi:MAG: hypothetical protein ACYC2Y_06390 [Armatimonadota bacterium]